MSTNETQYKVQPTIRREAAFAAFAALGLALSSPPSFGGKVRLPKIRRGNRYMEGHDAGVQVASGAKVRGANRNQRCDGCGQKRKRCRC